MPSTSLSAVPSTLRIPLAARAVGTRLFPSLDVQDRYAAEALSRMDDDGQEWLRDRQSVYGVLARTHSFKDQARRFVAQHPDAHVVNLGCGLSHYLQWLDNGRMRMTDADLAEVMAIRRKVFTPAHERHVQTELDLSQPDWWDLLGLPQSRDEAPVFLMSEGVFMYLQPETVQSVLATFGERAPSGSIFTFDVMCWLSVGRAKLHTSVKQTGAQFNWGPRKLRELTAPHPALRLQNVQQVMGEYSLFYKILQPSFQAVTGVPFYAVYSLKRA